MTFKQVVDTMVVLVSVILIGILLLVLTGAYPKDPPEEIIKVVIVEEVTEHEETIVLADEITEPAPEWQEFTATAYCPCVSCCGKWAEGRGEVVVGALGVELTAGESIAADWNVLPAGTTVEIEGMGEFTVHDKGGAVKGSRVDIYFDSHAEALAFGRKTVRVRTIS